MKSILLYVHGIRLASQLNVTQMVSGHTAANTTFNIKINGTNRSVTSDENGYFELDLTGGTLTSLREMFSNNTSLTDVTLDIDTSQATDMYDMFYNCQNVTTINGLDTLDTSNVTNMGRLFFNCNKWENFEDVSGWDTGSVTDMDGVFLSCNKITDLDFLSGWDTSSVTTMYGMFDSCGGLVDVTGISGWDTSSVTAFDFMFSTCSNLTSVDVNGWDMSSVVTINNMFFDCNSLTFMDLSDWDILNTTGFSNFCPDLSTLTVVYDSTIFKSEIVTNRPNVNWIDVGAHTISGFTSDTNSITLKINGTNNTVTPDSNKYFYYDVPLGTTLTSLYQMLMNASNVVTVIIGKYINTQSVTTFAYMFGNCTSLTKIYGLKYMDTSSVTDLSYLFSGAELLDSLEGVERWDTSNVTNMHGLASIKFHDLTPISGWDTSSVTDMGAMFTNCNLITDLTPISGWNTSSVQDFSLMFGVCTGLTDISPIYGWNTGSATTLASLFQECNHITSVDLHLWNTTNVTRVYDMFTSCTRLVVVNLSGWVGANIVKDATASLTGIEDMFSGCSALQTVDMENWNPTHIIDISNLFKDCTKLKKLNIARWNTTGIPSVSTDWANFIPNSGSITVIRDSRIFKTNIENSFSNVNWVDPHSICGYTTANTTFTFPVNDVDRSVTSDSNGYFYFDLPSNETLTSLVCMLKDNTSVTKLWFGDIDVTHVTDLTNMCLRATGLTEIKGARYWNLSSCTSIENAFNNCTSLASMNVKNWNVPVLTNSRRPFRNLRATGSIDLSGWTGFSGVVDCLEMFSMDVTSTKTIDIRTLDTRNVTSYDGFVRNENSTVVYYNSTIFNSSIKSRFTYVNWFKVA